MAEQAPNKTVADTIAAFRSTDQNGKSEQDYQGVLLVTILRKPWYMIYAN
jgi:hypothetical protein